MKAKMTVEIRLLYVTVWLFIMAQSVFTNHPWNQYIRIVALLAFIGALLLRARVISR